MVGPSSDGKLMPAPPSIVHEERQVEAATKPTPAKMITKVLLT